MATISIKLVVSILVTLFTLTYIIADCFFRQNAFSQSNEFAASAQEKLGTGFFRYFFVFFCDIFHPIAIALIILLYYALASHKVRTLAFLMYFFLMCYLLSILKLIYHDPRPYWADPHVKALECYSEYGNPSGHSMLAIILFGYWWRRHIWIWVEHGQLGFLSVWQREQCQMKENFIREGPAEIPRDTHVTMKYCLFTIATFLIVFFILFGRIFLGMHSYNEVFLGCVYGIFFLYMYVISIEAYLIALIHSIIVKSAHDINENFQCISWMLLALLSVFYLAFLLIPIIAFEACKSHASIPENWYLAIRSSCPSNTLLQMFYYKSFQDCGVVSVVFGILFGILITRGEHTIAVNDDSSVPINEKNAGRHALRALIILFLGGGIAGGFTEIPNHQDVYLAYFVNNNLGLFLSGIFLIKVVPFLFNKCKLDQEGDFLKYEGGEIFVRTESEQEGIAGGRSQDVEMAAKVSAANTN